MASQRSNSSEEQDEDYTTTNTLLGFASKEPTNDQLSHLGGVPTWLDPGQPPSAALARCKTCQDLMPLLLQLHSDLPDYFPGHERQLYIFGCRRRNCRRKEGCVRAIRALRVLETTRITDDKIDRKTPVISSPETQQSTQHSNLGDRLFGTDAYNGINVKPFFSKSNPSANPFTIQFKEHDGEGTRPSRSGNLAPEPAQVSSIEHLHATFAHKAQISLSPPIQKAGYTPEPWPLASDLPPGYPSYHLDAEYETLDAPTQPSTATEMMDMDPLTSGNSIDGAKDDADTFESTIDKAFQRFADRLAQNPLQVLRYEFGGVPLLYSKTDQVGRLLAPHQGAERTSNGKIAFASQSRSISMPRCPNCAAARKFEMQLTPPAITELEADEIGLEGMEWGTIIIGVCEQDCKAQEVIEGQISYLEEWAGVQWEERIAPRK